MGLPKDPEPAPAPVQPPPPAYGQVMGLQAAMGPGAAAAPVPPAQIPKDANCNITVQLGNTTYNFAFKADQTLWELYTDLATKTGLKQSFHFIDKNHPHTPYKEHMFDKTFAAVGFSPSRELRVVRDDM